MNELQKIKNRQYQKTFRENHKGYYKAYMDKYRVEHNAEFLARSRRYYQIHKNELKDKRRKWNYIVVTDKGRKIFTRMMDMAAYMGYTENWCRKYLNQDIKIQGCYLIKELNKGCAE